MRVVFDLDGTLADDSHRVRYLERRPKDWRAYFEACDRDEPITPVVETLRALLGEGHRVSVWTGRSASVREKTIRWLAERCQIGVKGTPSAMASGPYIPACYRLHELRMRPEGDRRPDVVLKAEWLEAEPEPLHCVFDDRNAVVAMWREKGVRCFQVALGDF